MKYLLLVFLLGCGSVQRIKKEAVASGARLQNKTETIIIKGIKDAEKEISDCLDDYDSCPAE